MTEDNLDTEDLNSLEKRILSDKNAGSILLASGPGTVKKAIEHSTFLEEAKKENSILPQKLLDICLKKGITPGPEQYLACVSFYTFVQSGLKESIDYLIAYVNQHKVELPMDWASHFATHALKILTGQQDTDDKYIFYNTGARKDTIARALNYLHNHEERK